MTRNTTSAGDHLLRDANEERDDGRVGRAVFAALGSALVFAGLRRRSLRGAAMALAGGWLLYRGLGRRDSSRSGNGGTQTEWRSAELEEREPTETGSTAGPTEVERSVTVDGSAEDLYHYWRDPEQLNRILGDFGEVSAAGEDRLRWSVDAPLGRSLAWETDVLEDRPGEFLRWKSNEDATLPNEWSVRFRPAPADRGTEVTLGLRVEPPGGRVGRTAMELLGVVPEALANETLSRFKSLAETGEIPTLEGNPSARGSGDIV